MIGIVEIRKYLGSHIKNTELLRKNKFVINKKWLCYVEYAYDEWYIYWESFKDHRSILLAKQTINRRLTLQDGDHDDHFNKANLRVKDIADSYERFYEFKTLSALLKEL